MIVLDVMLKFNKNAFIDEEGKPLILSTEDQDGYLDNFYSKLVLVYNSNTINAEGVLVFPSKLIVEDNTLLFHVLVFPNGKEISDIKAYAAYACSDKLQMIFKNKILLLKKGEKQKSEIKITFNPYIPTNIEHIGPMLQLHGIDDPNFVPLTSITSDIDDLYENCYKINPISILLENTLDDELDRLANIANTKFCEEFRGVPRCYIIPKTEKITIAKLLCDRLFDANLSMSLNILFRDMIRYDLAYKDRQVFIEDDFILYEGNPIVITIDELCKREVMLNNNEANLEYMDQNIFKEYKEKYCNTTPLIFATDSYKVAEELQELASNYHICVKNLLPLVKIGKARTYLKEKAQLDGFNRFYGKIQEIDNEKFTLKKLNKIYSDWKIEYMNRKIGGITKQKTDNSNIHKTGKELLNEMVGLKPIKSIIRDILSIMQMQEELKRRSLAVSNPCRHMVFYGNPGTAKTTVARLLGRILKENNILNTNKFIEVGKSDLVAGYVGQTAIKTKDKINKAKGGILFIDEAYSLNDDLYGKECIDVIVQEMENIREDTIIIFAGYKADMEKFLQSNRGLSSRIAFHVEFDDYSTPELIDITKLILKEKNYSITKDALSVVASSINTHINDKDFGNGRFIRNIIEQSMMKQATRITKNNNYKTMSNEDLTKLESYDIVDPKKSKVKVIGF